MTINYLKNYLHVISTKLGLRMLDETRTSYAIRKSASRNMAKTSPYASRNLKLFDSAISLCTKSNSN